MDRWITFNWNRLEMYHWSWNNSKANKYIGFYWKAKFLRSSAKIIIQLSLSSSHTQLPQPWICNICSHSNRANMKCTECGTEKAIAADIACIQCTYINSPRSAVCEMCNSKLVVSETKYDSTRSIQIKFSFRDNGCTETFNFLKNNLRIKSWEVIIPFAFWAQL